MTQHKYLKTRDKLSTKTNHKGLGPGLCTLTPRYFPLTEIFDSNTMEKFLKKAGWGSS